MKELHSDADMTQGEERMPSNQELIRSLRRMAEAWENAGKVNDDEKSAVMYIAYGYWCEQAAERMDELIGKGEAK